MNCFKVTIGKYKSGNFINVYIDKKRYRYWSGKNIGVKINSIDNIELLRAAFELKLREGWRPIEKIKETKTLPISVSDALKHSKKGIALKNCSDRYIQDIDRVIKLWRSHELQYGIKNIKINELNEWHIANFIIRPKWGNKTQQNIKYTLSALLNNFRPNLVSSIKLNRPNSKLHKPIDNLNDILRLVKAFNENLYLCCLLTYGCLLRPHREIRELTWHDFSDDLKYIYLSGNRNKSGRNRVVPVPFYIRDVLIRGESHHNIFTGNVLAFNKDYFKTLWSRFKKQSDFIEPEHTLYSFRHTGAIEIFKRTGSLTKLQKAMGHSSLNVSLTYLRGLEVAELKEEDMPMV